jgi:hypothetical protein
MSDLEMQNLLDAMKGARFDEFCIRKSSMRFRFSQGVGVESPVFILETNSNISFSIKKLGEYEETTPNAANELFRLLEFNLSELTKVADNGYFIRFDNGNGFYVFDFDGLWDNIFSVRVLNWPNTGDRGHFLY